VSVEDARRLSPGACVEADVCIVGGGAAGLTLALELAKSGLQICLLESGGVTPDAQVQALYDLESTGYPQRQDYMSRARYFGGSCNLWAGRSMLLDPLDFQTREWVPHSGWPIAYADVAKYYPQAATLLQLPALDGDDLGRFLKPLSDSERSLFADGALRPTTSLWARNTQRFGKPWLRRLRGTNNVRMLLYASATQLELNSSGNTITGLQAATPTGSRLQVRARRYVLACGGLENARLLLASRDRSPHGIGNDHDQVGRYFMDHPRTVYGRVHVPAGVRLSAFRGRPLPDGKLQIGIGLSPRIQRQERLLNH
jgi:choline dehydrogenase-like flavoprotein